MNPVLRASAAHVFVGSVASPVLDDDDDRHHLMRVLRLRDGESVTVSDGAGRWRPTRFVGGALEPTGEVVEEASPAPCTIATAIPKGDRLEWMVQKLTEVGVGEVRLLHFERSVVRWDADRASRHLSRLDRIARDAAMQSRRVWLPRIVGPEPALSVLALPGAVLADPAAEVGPVGSCTVIGPEGGLTASELAVAGQRVSLGDTVLRVETAALVAAVHALWRRG